MTQSEQEVFGGLSVPVAEAEEGLAKSQRRRRNGGICVCGHSFNAHTENVEPGASPVHDAARAAKRNTCAPSKHVCPCAKYAEVLTTQDVRRFRYGTTGPDAEHALVKGITASYKAGTEVWWDPNAECVRCHEGMVSGAKLGVVAYDHRWFEAKGPTDMNVLICKNCRDTVELEWAGIDEFQRPVR